MAYTDTLWGRKIRASSESYYHVILSSNSYPYLAKLAGFLNCSDEDHRISFIVYPLEKEDRPSRPKHCFQLLVPENGAVSL